MDELRQTKSESELTLSWRIGLPQYETDEAFDRLLQLTRQHASIVDEVALFDTITHHQYIPLDVYASRMELVSRRLAAFRAAGISRVGINVLCTIGHLNEAWSYMPPLPYQAIVGHDGGLSKGCACPNNPQMRTYIRAKYQLAAQAKPDFIWVDDDIRMHHHGVPWGCFCDTCLDIFSTHAGRKYARQELVQAFDQPDQGRLRELWVEQNISTLESLLRDVAAAIHGVNPHIATGLMTCGPSWTTYSGQALDRWFRALKATKARPGGGFYSDATPIEMVHKALECGRQCVALPPTVTDIQFEMENFPYQLLKKSGTAMVNECTLGLASGLNGIAFNMMLLGTVHEDFAPLLEKVHPARRMWEQLVAHTVGLPTVGLWPAWSSQLMARRSLRQGEHWLDPWQPQYNITQPNILSEIGLPLVGEHRGLGTILCGRVAEALSDEQLTRILCGGVLMDSTALEVLTERGLDPLTGVRLGERLDNGVVERFTTDPFNGPTAGEIRDVRIEFWGNAKGLGDVLAPAAEGVRVLTTMEDYFHRPLGSAMTAFENPLGGRVVVMGYAPWMFLHSVGKRRQLLNVADWMTRNTIPVRIDQPVRLVPIVRLSADRSKGAIVLLNAGMDEVSEATIHIRAKVANARLLSIGRPDQPLPFQPEATGGHIMLQNIAPWSVHVILLDA